MFLKSPVTTYIISYRSNIVSMNLNFHNNIYYHSLEHVRSKIEFVNVTFQKNERAQVKLVFLRSTPQSHIDVIAHKMCFKW